MWNISFWYCEDKTENEIHGMYGMGHFEKTKDVRKDPSKQTKAGVILSLN